MDELGIPYLVEILSFVLKVLIFFIIGFSGSLLSDVWYYKRDKQPINIAQDIIVGLFFAMLINVLDIFFTFDTRVLVGVTFFLGIFGIDLLGLILQPKFLILFIKNFFAELKGNPAAKALSSTIKDYKQETKEEKEEEKKEAEKKEKEKHRQERLEVRRKRETDLHNDDGDDVRR